MALRLWEGGAGACQVIGGDDDLHADTRFTAWRQFLRRDVHARGGLPWSPACGCATLLPWRLPGRSPVMANCAPSQRQAPASSPTRLTRPVRPPPTVPTHLY